MDVIEGNLEAHAGYCRGRSVTSVHQRLRVIARCWITDGRERHRDVKKTWHVHKLECSGGIDLDGGNDGGDKLEENNEIEINP